MKLYNTLSKKTEDFFSKSINIGLYVCGPTVYGDSHLGHARCAVIFDVLYRYLLSQGYKVRYVRNITDVGHLTEDWKDKILEKAKLEKLEPMEVAQKYTNSYHDNLKLLNCLPPSIEPTASGHIIEQIEFIKEIIDHGFAYVSNGSVYFDVEKYSQIYPYSQLSGRSLDDPNKEGTRETQGQEEKKSPRDFALWKKANPEHIMHWPSPWSEGFPGWHIECSAMSRKYLGEQFDIHGGGLDLMFPHHEAEIMQGCSVSGLNPARYWVHCNLITINGNKMGKSYNNFITMNQLFSGEHELLGGRAFNPMALRLFILMANYKSPLDFSVPALDAAESGFLRLNEAYKKLKTTDWKVSQAENTELSGKIRYIITECGAALCNDLDTPKLVSSLFEAAKVINQLEKPSVKDLKGLNTIFEKFAVGVLGLAFNTEDKVVTKAFMGALDILLNIRLRLKEAKNYEVSDEIRKDLEALGFTIKDGIDKTDWSL